MTEAVAQAPAQRPGWLAHDLLILADPNGPRTERWASLAERRALSRRGLLTAW
jgi:hypothetical protein